MPAEIASDLVALLPRLLRYAKCVARDPEISQDLVQSGCERALATPEGPSEGVAFEAWMFRIFRLRKQQTEGLQVDVDEQDDLAVESGDRAVEAKLTFERVRIAIDELPVEQREVMLLVCVEEFSYKEAAQVLGIPVGTVMSRLARARTKVIEMTQGKTDLAGKMSK
jgi:RNA polymerase sigma-70 factor, ECF subfamily